MTKRPCLIFNMYACLIVCDHRVVALSVGGIGTDTGYVGCRQRGMSVHSQQRTHVWKWLAYLTCNVLVKIWVATWTFGKQVGFGVYISVLFFPQSRNPSQSLNLPDRWYHLVSFRVISCRSSNSCTTKYMVKFLIRFPPHPAPFTFRSPLLLEYTWYKLR